VRISASPEPAESLAETTAGALPSPARLFPAAGDAVSTPEAAESNLVMTIRTRLILGLLAIAVVLLVPLGLSLRSLERVDDDVSRLRNEEINRLVLLRRAPA
jgi:hypothetical protein